MNKSMIKRYDVVLSKEEGYARAQILESPTGEFVKHKEALAEIERLENRVELLEDCLEQQARAMVGDY